MAIRTRCIVLLKVGLVIFSLNMFLDCRDGLSGIFIRKTQSNRQTGRLANCKICQQSLNVNDLLSKTVCIAWLYCLGGRYLRRTATSSWRDPSSACPPPSSRTSSSQPTGQQQCYYNKTTTTRRFPCWIRMEFLQITRGDERSWCASQAPERTSMQHVR